MQYSNEDLTTELLRLRNTETYNLFLRLFDQEIGRLRKENDEAEGAEIHRNQGGIAILKKIKSDLEVTMIGDQHSGAYNV